MKSKRSISSVSSFIASVGLAVILSACAGVNPDQVSEAPSVPNLEDPSQRSVSLLRYCESLHESGDLELAATMCNRAHELNPADPEPLLQLAGIMQSLGMRDSAAEAYRSVLLIDPQRVDALYGLGKIHIDNQRYDMARLQLEEALHLADDDPRIYNALGVIMDQQGDHAVAQDYYHQGLNRSPQSVSLRNNLGLSLVLDGDPQAGLALLREVAAEPTAGPAASRNLAMAHEMAARPTSDSIQTPIAQAPIADVEVAEPTFEIETAAAQTVVTVDTAPPAISPAPTASHQVVRPSETVTNDLSPAAQTRQAAVTEMPADSVPAEIAPSEVVFPEINRDREIAAPVAPVTEAVAGSDPATEPVRLLDGPVSASIWETRTAGPALAASDIHPPATPGRSAASPVASVPHDTRVAAAISAAPSVAPPGDAPYPIRKDAPMTIAQAIAQAIARAAAPITGPAPHDGGEDFARSAQPSPQGSDLTIETASATEAPPADEWIHSVQLSSFPSAEGARQSWREIRETAAEVLDGIDAVILRADLGAEMGVVYRVRTDAMNYRQAADLCARLKEKGLDCFSVKASRQSTIEATVERICALGTSGEDCGAPKSGPLRNTALPSSHPNAG